jgi:hypothetical protein
MKNPEIVLAILGAGALIGAGIFFGLRGQPRAAEAPPPAASPAVTPRRAPPSPAQPASAPGPAVSAQEELRAEVERRRSALLKACWEPAVAKNPEPRSSEQVWNGTIGPEGTPLAFSIQELRGKSRPEVVSCLQDQLASLRLSPRPTATFVELPFKLP